MEKKEIETFCPTSLQEWRQWLEENHRSKQSIWVLYYKKKSNVASITYTDAVDEALCFGWIDSTRRAVDDHTFIQFFCKRKPNSVWSKVNKAKVQRLIDAGLFAQAGHESIEIAKQNGSWAILDDVEELIIPEDLEKEFETKEGSMDFFLSLSKSVRKSILQWLVLAKRPETRQKRITEIAELAAQKLKPKQF
ncbi:YdeI family protein [Pedobacter foliorum]|uniref:YdeI/OmpD-associated family protein n=1 Tax=Pedobacter foliorum TaxID=2739058 RepID=UPI0015656C79|nr:YdeI/OmpD-associated family protein [Pedobacter foliorum]NRF41093.1 YdeI/OmpD-associated family protein [Pedobacter foliorum]